MPVFYKQGGTWKEVNSPYIKQDGEWITPEQVYVKENGKWRLIFELFNFEVQTVSHQEQQSASVLEGELTQFESFTASNIYFFDQTLFEPETAEAVAVDEERDFTAVGSASGEVYIYDNNFGFTQGNNVGNIPVYLNITDSNSPINDVEFYDNQNLFVASDKLRVYDENFNLTKTFEDADTRYTCLDVYEDEGNDAGAVDGVKLAAGVNDSKFYAYSLNSGTWNFDIEHEQDGFDFSTVKSISWEQYQGRITLGTGSGSFFLIYDYSNPPAGRSEYTGVTGNCIVEFGPENEEFPNLAVIDENRLQVLKIFSNTTLFTFDTADFGPEGDVAWNSEKKLAYASTNDRIYVFDGTDNSYNQIHTFNEADRQYKSLDWNSQNKQIVGGTSQFGEGDAHLFSTGVRTFFDWSEVGSGLDNRQKAEGVNSSKPFQAKLESLSPATEYEFRAGAKASEERTVIDGNSLTFTTVDMQTQTDPVTNLTSTSATLNGTLVTFDRNNSNPFAHFEWGEGGGPLTNKTEGGPIDNIDGTVFTKSIQNLEKGAEYEFQAVTQFGGVTTLGSKVSFTTKDVTASLSGVTDPTDFGEVFVESPVGQEVSDEVFTLIETSGTGTYTVNSGDVTIGGEVTLGVPNPFSDVTTGYPLTVSQSDSKNLTVRFDPPARGSFLKSIEIAHGAPTPENPFTITLEGEAEVVPTLEVQNTSFETVADGNKDIKTFTIEETGLDYSATITSFVESSNQPSQNPPELSEWTIEDKPGSLPGDNTIVVAGGSSTFDIGWDAASGSPENQNYAVDIVYKGTGIEDDTINRVTIDGQIVSAVEVKVDPEDDGNASISYVFEDTFVGDNLGSDTQRTVEQFGDEIPVSSFDNDRTPTLVEFALLESPVGDYEVSSIDITGSNSSAFNLLNVPSTPFTVGTEESFDIEFDPSINSFRQAKLEVSHDAAGDNPHIVDLEGSGIKSSEIVVDKQTISHGAAIEGGNIPAESQGSGSVTVTNPSSYESFDVKNVLLNTDEEFRINNYPNDPTVTENTEFTIDTELVPQQGTDGENFVDVLNIFHDAYVGPDPEGIELTGELQVTNLTYQSSGNTFDPTTPGPDFVVYGAPDSGVPYEGEFEVAVPLAEEVGTNVVVEEADESGLLNLFDPTGTELTQNTNQITQDLLSGQSRAIGMKYSPQSAADDNIQETLTVEYDNQNQTNSVLVEGQIGSTANVATYDPNTSVDNDAEIDFGQVTANTTKQGGVVLYEENGNQDYQITVDGFFQDGTVNYSSEGNFTSGTVVSEGSPITEPISFSPTESQIGNTVSDTFEFGHDAFYVPQAYEQSPVTISLTAEVVSPPVVEMTEDQDGSTPVSYSAEVSEESETAIRISEIGFDNAATVQSFSLSDNGPDGSFGLNSDNNTDYTNFNTTISAGNSITEPVVAFNPDNTTGSTPDFIVGGELEITYTGNGIDGTETSTVVLEGEVIRPAKANVGSQSSSPLNMGTFNVQSGSGVNVFYKRYSIQEENFKNSYTIDEPVLVTGDTNFENATDDPPGGDIIQQGTTVDPIGTVYGNVKFTYDTSQDSPGEFQALLRLPHDAPREGNNDAGSDPSVLEINVFAEVNETN